MQLNLSHGIEIVEQIVLVWLRRCEIYIKCQNSRVTIQDKDINQNTGSFAILIINNGLKWFFMSIISSNFIFYIIFFVLEIILWKCTWRLECSFRKNFNPMCNNWPTFFTRVWFSAKRVAKIDGSIILTDNCNYLDLPSR